MRLQNAEAAMMPLALALIDLDGFESLDPIAIIVLMIGLVGLSVALGLVGLVSFLDRRKGGCDV